MPKQIKIVDSKTKKIRFEDREEFARRNKFKWTDKLIFGDYKIDPNNSQIGIKFLDDDIFYLIDFGINGGYAAATSNRIQKGKNIAPYLGELSKKSLATLLKGEHEHNFYALLSVRPEEYKNFQNEKDYKKNLEYKFSFVDASNYRNIAAFFHHAVCKEDLKVEKFVHHDWLKKNIITANLSPGGYDSCYFKKRCIKMSFMLAKEDIPPNSILAFDYNETFLSKKDPDTKMEFWKYEKFYLKKSLKPIPATLFRKYNNIQDESLENPSCYFEYLIRHNKIMNPFYYIYVFFSCVSLHTISISTFNKLKEKINLTQFSEDILKIPKSKMIPLLNCALSRNWELFIDNIEPLWGLDAPTKNFCIFFMQTDPKAKAFKICLDENDKNNLKLIFDCDCPDLPTGFNQLLFDVYSVKDQYKNEVKKRNYKDINQIFRLAIAKNNIEDVRELIKKGYVSLNAKNRKGKTPLEIAQSAGGKRKEIAKLIKEALEDKKTRVNL